MEIGNPVLTSSGNLGKIIALHKEVAGKRSWWVKMLCGPEIWFDEDNLTLLVPKVQTLKSTNFEEILKNISYPGYKFHVTIDGEKNYLQGEFSEKCSISGGMSVQKTRKWVLSKHMTKSEFVQTVFKCVITSMEHSVREHFKYREKAVYSPHYDVDALWGMRTMDYRQGE